MPPILRKSAWTPEEDAKISELVSKYGARKWAFIAASLPGRKPKQCKCQLRGAIYVCYSLRTNSCSSLMPLFHLLFSGRERWHNHLQPDISKALWTEEEDRIILEFHQSDGNKWADMARKLPGRYVHSVESAVDFLQHTEIAHIILLLFLLSVPITRPRIIGMHP